MHDDRNTYGDELRTRRLALNLSVKKLAKLSGVSRRHITTVERNGNISVVYLKKLMQAMHMTQITICSGIELRAGMMPPDPAALEEAAVAVERSIHVLQDAAERVKTFAGRVGKYARNDTPKGGAFSDRGSALIRQFAERVRTISDDPEKLRRVEQDVSRFLDATEASDRVAKATPRRRRKRTA